MLGLADSNRRLRLYEEGISQVKEALGIFERLGDTEEQAWSLIKLAGLLSSRKQFDAAEEAGFRAIGLVPENDKQYLVCASHQVLGEIYESKGEIEKAVHHYEMVLEIASPFNWHDDLFRAYCSLGTLFLNEDRFEDAIAHIERAKPHAIDDTFTLGSVTRLQAWAWFMLHRLEEARSEALAAANIFEELGAVDDLESCRSLLQDIEGERSDWLALYLDGELLETALLRTPINSPWPLGY